MLLSVQQRCQRDASRDSRRDASRDSRRDASSDSSICSTIHCLSAVVMHVRCARADPALQCSSISCAYPVISVINIGSTVPHCSGSYFLFVVRTWYVPVPVTPWNQVPLGYVTNIAYNTTLLW